MSKLKELEKRRDDAIAGIECILKRRKLDDLFGTNTTIDIVIRKEYGGPRYLHFSDWRQVKKLKATITELLESING